MVEHATASPGDVTFTRDWYRDFLEDLQSRDREFKSFAQPPEVGEVYLRHDVDLSLQSALEMARIEADLGVESTYFLLLTSPLYNPFEAESREIVRALTTLGHDVGLHFNTHVHWSEPPGTEALERVVASERAALETIVPTTDAVSFHRPPSWVLDRSFDDFSSTYAPELFSEIDYLADSTHRWRDNPPRLTGTEPVQILTHPGLWGEEDADFDSRVEEAITAACRGADRKTTAEYLSKRGAE